MASFLRAMASFLRAGRALQGPPGAENDPDTDTKRHRGTECTCISVAILDQALCELWGPPFVVTGVMDGSAGSSEAGPTPPPGGCSWCCVGPRVAEILPSGLCVACALAEVVRLRLKGRAPTPSQRATWAAILQDLADRIASDAD